MGLELKHWIISATILLLLQGYKALDLPEDECKNDSCRLPAYAVYMSFRDEDRSDQDRVKLEHERMRKGLPRFADYPHLKADWEKK